MAKATTEGGKGNRTFTKRDVQKDTARRIIKGAFTKKNLKASAADVAMMLPVGRGVKAAELAGKALQVVNKSAKGRRVITRAAEAARVVRKPPKTPTIAKEREAIVKKASEKLATRNRTQLSRAMDKVKVSPESLGSKTKSGKPTPNKGGGLRTTTGQGKKKTSREDVYEAVKTMREKPGGSSQTAGTGEIRATAPKPDVRITTRTGTPKKDTVTKPVKRTLNKRSAVTIKRTEPRKAKDVLNERAKANRDKMRELLTPKVNPARPKVTPKKAIDRTRREANTPEAEKPQGITVRGKFYPDKNPGIPARDGQPQGTIESRVTSRTEKPTFGTSRNNKPDTEADTLVNKSIRALENPKAAETERIKPGQRTKVARAIKRGTSPQIKKAVANQRRVLRQREITEAAKRAEKAGQ